MTRRAVYTDGIYHDRTKCGNWAALDLRTTSGQQQDTSSQEVELRAIIETVKMADAPCTIISDHKGIVGIAPQGADTAPRRGESFTRRLTGRTSRSSADVGTRRSAR